MTVVAQAGLSVTSICAKTWEVPMCVERMLEMVSTVLTDPLNTDHGN